MTTPDSGSWLRVTLVLAGTAVHFLLVAFWLVRARRRWCLTPDEIAFHTMVVGLGSLSAVLHLLAATVGLSWTRGVVGLLAIDAAATATLFGRWQRRKPGDSLAPDGHGDSAFPGGLLTGLAAGGAAVVTALLIDWVGMASRSLAVMGADAEHYHVPHAVNIALGASLFGLPATHHVYPMGTSVLAAWFIAPLRDPLLVDLATVLPFLLAWFTIARLLHELTGRSGLAWAPWCALLFFSTRLARNSLFVSADLFYTAAFLAVNVLMLRFAVRLRLHAIDLLALALAVGMLLSAKVTGAMSVVTLAGVYGVAALGRRYVTGPRFSLPKLSAGRVSLLLVLVVLSGGIWALRNWWAFGSPVAPSGLSVFGLQVFPGGAYQDSMYSGSVLRDISVTSHYDVVARLRYWVSVWLGAWFLPAGTAFALLALDVALQVRAARRLDDATTTKLIFLAATGVICAAQFLVLAGVPWSSLEQYEGFTLRYLLPCFALYLVAAYASCFVNAWRASRRSRLLAAVLVSAGGVGWFMAGQSPGGIMNALTPGRLTLWPVILAAATVGTFAVLAKTARRAVWPLMAAIAILASAGAAWSVTRDDRSLVRAANSAFVRESPYSRPPPGIHRGVYLALLASEHPRGIICAARRIFVTTRWDPPLDLQPPRYENQVFDVRGSSFSPRLVGRARPGTQPCDYLIAERQELDSVRGVPLVNDLKSRTTLHAVAEYGPFVVFSW